jgi:hypothetical protein
VGNYYVAGPMSKADRLLMHEDCSPDHPEWACPLPDPSIYIAGNVALPAFTNPAADNWSILAYNFRYTPLPRLFRRLVRLPQGRIPVLVQPAAEAYASVMADVGANARLGASGRGLPNLDAVDARLLAEVVHRTGPTTPISSPADVGGYPVVDPGTPVVDSDHDGMPDVFELRRGHDPYDPSDGAADPDGDGYTNLEDYLNGVE